MQDRYICTTKVHTAISRKVVAKNAHATIPKGNMGYDQYTVPDFVAVEPTFVALVNICPWPLVIGVRAIFGQGGGGEPFAQKILSSCPNFYETVVI